MQASLCGGFSCGGARALEHGASVAVEADSGVVVLGSGAQAQQLWLATGSAASRHVGSSQTRGENPGPPASQVDS